MFHRNPVCAFLATGALVIGGCSEPKTEIQVSTSEMMMGEPYCTVSMESVHDTAGLEVVYRVEAEGKGSLCFHRSGSGGQTQDECEPSYTWKVPCASVERLIVESVSCTDGGEPANCGDVTVTNDGSLATEVADGAATGPAQTPAVEIIVGITQDDRIMNCKRAHYGRFIPDAPGANMEIEYNLHAGDDVVAICTTDGGYLESGVACRLPKGNFTCADLDRVTVTNVTCTNEDGSPRDCGEIVARGSGLTGSTE